MANRTSAAGMAVDGGACDSVDHHFRPNSYTPHIRRTACDTVTLDTPSVEASDLTTDPYATQGVRLARENPIRRATAFANGAPNEYFEWRQSIGNSYYEEQERLAGRVAANDNQPVRRKAAA